MSTTDSVIVESPLYLSQKQGLYTQQMKYECFEVDDKINKNVFVLIGRILKRRAESREPERATKTKVNNDIEVLKESKRHTFQV